MADLSTMSDDEILRLAGASQAPSTDYGAELQGIGNSLAQGFGDVGNFLSTAISPVTNASNLLKDALLGTHSYKRNQIPYASAFTGEGAGTDLLNVLKSQTGYDITDVQPKTSAGIIVGDTLRAAPNVLMGGEMLPTMLSGAGSGTARAMGLGPEAQLLMSLAAPMGAGAVKDAYSGTRDWFSPQVASASSLEDPIVQRGLQYADRQGDLLNKPSEDITRIGRNTGEALDRIQNLASNDNLETQIAAKLGANSGKSTYERAVAQDFKEGLPQVRESGILNELDPAKGSQGLLDKVSDRLKSINDERTLTADKLDTVFHGVNDPNTPLSDMTGAMSKKNPEIQTAVSTLNKRIDKLELNSLSKPIADSLKSTMNEILGDLSPATNDKGVTRMLTPSNVIKMQQNLNEVRANLLQEFDSRQVGAALQGNTPKSASDLKASIEAIGTLQNALKQGLESQVGELAQASGMKISPNIFTKLNNEYGALKSLEKMGDKFQFGTSELFANKGATLIQNPGAQQELSLLNPLSPKSMIGDYIGSKLNTFTDAQSPATRQLGIISDREQNAIKDIQDLLYFNKNPINLTPLEPKLPVADRITDRAYPALLQVLSGKY